MDRNTSMKRRIENLLKGGERNITIITTQKDCEMCKIGNMASNLEKFLRSVRQGFIPVEMKVIKTKNGLVNLYGKHRIPIGDVIEIKVV